MTAAVTAVVLAAAAWLVSRWIQESQRIDLIAMVLSTPIPPDVRVAATPPAPRTGPAPAELPLGGAGPTLMHPAPANAQPARRAPGRN